MDESKTPSGDTTKILPTRVLHVIVLPGPFLACRHCGAQEAMEMPLFVNQAIQVMKAFREKHSKCPKPAKVS